MIPYYYIICGVILIFALGWLFRNWSVCRVIIRFTTKWLPVIAGSVVGTVFADWALFQNPRPAICVFLQTPLIWLFSYIDRLRIFPSESLGGLIIVIPLWFVYWACLGALIGFLLRLSFCLFRKWRHWEATDPQ
jgi:hypothetical protein